MIIDDNIIFKDIFLADVRTTLPYHQRTYMPRDLRDLVVKKRHLGPNWNKVEWDSCLLSIRI